MDDAQTPAWAVLDAWREQQADRLDPLRFHVMEALDRRLVLHAGTVRDLLEQRLSALLQAYADDLEGRAPDAVHDAGVTLPGPGRGELGQLVDDMSGRSVELADERAASDGAVVAPAMPITETLAEFRRLWSRLRAESQLRQSLEHVPTDAGPLNSAALVHRSIALMRELSPGYLQQFLAYVDHLSWIERLNAGGPASSDDASRVPAARKRSQKPRGHRQ